MTYFIAAFLVAILAQPTIHEAVHSQKADDGESNTTYILGPDDEVTVRVMEAEEIGEKPARIDMAGFIRLPLIGRLRAQGLTLAQLEAELTTRLKPLILKPDVSVTISDFRSQPVSVIGSVKNPGVHQLQGRKTLIEVLSLAGGVSADAGSRIKLTRGLEWGRIPLESAKDDSTGRFSIADISLKDILSANRPGENIIVLPHDVIAVPRAELIYVTGKVIRSGAFPLNERESISVLQALSLAGGLDRFASPKHARILRSAGAAQSRVEIAVDVSRILDNRAEDIALKPDDILFIPHNVPKAATVRAMETAIQIGTGVIIWR